MPKALVSEDPKPEEQEETEVPTPLQPQVPSLVEQPNPLPMLDQPPNPWQSSIEVYNRNIAVLGCSKLREYNLGMRASRRIRPNCHYAHWLKDLEVPNGTKDCRWTTVWHQGQVDIYVWNFVYRSGESKNRFQRAFLYEKDNSDTRIPNWAWGCACGCARIHRHSPMPN